MSEKTKRVIPVGNEYADVHKTADTLEAELPESAELQNGTMANAPKEKFWTLANLRLTFVNTIVVALVAISAAWTSNLLTQQALAARVDKLETLTNERGKVRDDQIKTLNDKLDNGVTKEVLKLQLDPIVKEQFEQRAILEQIRIAVVRSTPNYP